MVGLYSDVSSLSGEGTARQAAVPGNERMLRGIRRTVRRIAQRATDAYSRSALASIEVVLNELLCRERTDHYLNFYAESLNNVNEGLALLKPFQASAAGIARAVGELPGALPSTTDFKQIHAAINRVMTCLVDIVEALRAYPTAESAGYFARVTALELDLVASGQRFAAFDAAGEVVGDERVLTRDSFERYVKARFPERGQRRVTGFNELTGGYQKTTILVDFDGEAQQPESVVIRAEKDDRFVTLDAGDIRSEFEIVKLAHAAGVSVAEPLWIEPDAGPLGQRFFVSRKVPGQNLGTAVSTDAALTPDIILDFVKTLAKIHDVPTGASLRASPIGHWLQFATLQQNTLANVAYWMDQKWLAYANPSPILKRLCIWLEDNAPAEEGATCFIHGDYGLHNVLVHDGRVSGVLDWEAARVGDPAEDLSWFLQSSAGKIDSVQALNWYREATGREVSEYRLRYYDVFNCMKIMVGAACAAGMHERTPNAAIEWCNIPFIWAPLFAAQVQSKIDSAEAAKVRATG